MEKIRFTIKEINYLNFMYELMKNKKPWDVIEWTNLELLHKIILLIEQHEGVSK